MNALVQLHEDTFSIDQLATLYYVNSGSFSTLFGGERAGYYGVSGIPHSVFDGVIEQVGTYYTDGDVSHFTSYVNSRLAIPSPMTIDLYETKGKDSFDVTVDIYLEENIPQSSRLFLVACENHIDYGGKTYQFMVRCEERMYPIINEEPVGVYSAGQSTTFNATVDFEDLAYDNAEMMYLVAWVQDINSKEVLQACQLYDPPYDIDLSIQPASLGEIRALFQ